MTDELHHARSELETAARHAERGEVRETARELAAAFAAIGSGDREVDHAALDEHLNALRQAEQAADGETAERIERALEHAEAYRKELQGA